MLYVPHFPAGKSLGHTPSLTCLVGQVLNCLMQENQVGFTQERKIIGMNLII